jgi:outer membrane protein OmpU
MKKILLCTTALAGLVAGSAFAGDLNVTVSGNNKFEAGARKMNKNYSAQLPLTANQNSGAFFSTSKAAVNVTNKTDNNLTYGASIRLQVATNQSNGTDKESRMDRSHLFLDSDFGSVQLGTNVAASKLMQVSASDIASGTGGVDGDYPKFLNFSGSQNGTVVSEDGFQLQDIAVLGVDTLSNRKDGTTESAEKITYLSPRVEGVQFGMSYVPDLSNGGNSLNATTLNGATGSNPTYIYSTNYVRVRNLWSFGLNYKNTFNEVNVELAATADTGKSRQKSTTGQALKGNNAVNGVNTYTVGGLVGMRGFSVVASYAKDGDSALPKGLTNQSTIHSKFKSQWWTTGVAYANGPMSTSLTYLSGKKGYTNDTVKSQVVSLGADYEVAPGFKPFAEVTYAKFKPSNVAAIKATVFILGTRVKF